MAVSPFDSALWGRLYRDEEVGRLFTDGAEIRAAAVAMNIPLLTTLSAAAAAVAAIRSLRQKGLHYRSLQTHYKAV